MKKYTIEIFRVNRNGMTPVFTTEVIRDRFTKREFKHDVIENLIDIAGQSNKYKYLTAYVKCNGAKVLTVVCDTKEDGPGITSYITAARPRERFRKIRDVVIAC